MYFMTFYDEPLNPKARTPEQSASEGQCGPLGGQARAELIPPRPDNLNPEPETRNPVPRKTKPRAEPRASVGTG